MRIAAVVVTYNRLPLLKECITALKQQSRKPDAIVVINNGSTDGTREYLESDKDLICIHQENQGSAGGQYTGIKYAFDNSFDWVWCMDDDGRPVENTLEEFVKVANTRKDIKVANSLVLDINDPLRDKIWGYFGLNGTIANPKGDKLYAYRSEILKDHEERVLKGNIMFFNSCFFSYEVIEKVGFPNKDLFIRGEDYDYYIRVVQSGYTIYTLIDSLFLHPVFEVFYINFFGKTLHFDKLNEFKQYYFTRNYFYLDRKYKLFNNNFLCYFTKTVILELLFLSKTKRTLKELYLIFKTIIKAYSDSKKLS